MALPLWEIPIVKRSSASPQENEFTPSVLSHCLGIQDLMKLCGPSGPVTHTCYPTTRGRGFLLIYLKLYREMSNWMFCIPPQTYGDIDHAGP